MVRTTNIGLVNSARILKTNLCTYNSILVPAEPNGGHQLS